MINRTFAGFFHISFYTTQSLQSGDPCCYLQMGFAHFVYYELV